MPEYDVGHQPLSRDPYATTQSQNYCNDPVRRLGIAIWSTVSHSGLKSFICDDVVTLCRNLVNFSPVTTYI